MAEINSSYTKEELVENELIDVLGYLVALKDGRDYRFDIYEAIKKVKNALALLSRKQNEAP